MEKTNAAQVPRSGPRGGNGTRHGRGPVARAEAGRGSLAAPPLACNPRPRQRGKQVTFIDLTDVPVAPVAPVAPLAPVRAPRGSLRRKPGPVVVYLLMNSDSSKSYIGSSNDVDFRLRQHNRKQGAWYTSMSVKQGKPWRRALHVAGFATDAAARKFEDAWKNANVPFNNKKGMSIFTRKMAGLRELIPDPVASPLRIVWGAFIDMTWPGMVDE